MKYIVLLGDGMSDEPNSELNGQTPLEAAKTPNLDRLARIGQVGLAATVPDGYHPGSDVANLSVFGYDPRDCYSGRSPLEAASMGVALGPDDVAFRLNLVWLEAHFGKLYMGDFSAGHITTEEADQLVATLQDELGGDEFNFYPGVSYRHLMVWKNGKEQLTFTPPHDISTLSIEDYLPPGVKVPIFCRTSRIPLRCCFMIIRSITAGLRNIRYRPIPIWLWGHGKKPSMKTYQELFGLTGSVISAVDLIKGIGVNAGLRIIDVPGATGYLDTNYRAKPNTLLNLCRPMILSMSTWKLPTKPPMAVCSRKKSKR